MTAPEKPTPVAILVVPRLDGGGSPECGDCPLMHRDRCGYVWCNVDGELRADPHNSGTTSYNQIPAPTCPVHGPPETRATPF